MEYLILPGDLLQQAGGRRGPVRWREKVAACRPMEETWPSLPRFVLGSTLDINSSAVMQCVGTE